MKLKTLLATLIMAGLTGCGPAPEETQGQAATTAEVVKEAIVVPAAETGSTSAVQVTPEMVELAAFEEFQIGQMLDILRNKMIGRKLDARALDPGKVEGAGKQKRQKFAVRQGVDKDNARSIVKLLKESKLKVQAQIQGEQVRVTGKKRDDLQQAMALLRDADLEIPLQYENFRD